MIGTIFNIEEFAVHDGPGLRTAVFFKGCPLRCVWCHNPEGLLREPQLMVRETKCTHCGLCYRKCTHPECREFGRCLHICPHDLLSVSGENISAKELAARLKRGEKVIAGKSRVTFTGGEPLMQADFILELIDLLPNFDIAVETSGFADEENFRKVADRVNLVIMDIKLADGELHRKYTGCSNEIILNNLNYLKTTGKNCVIRTPLIPGITDTRENLDAVEALVEGLLWEKLPYNKLAGVKYPMLGMKFAYEEYVR